MPNHNYDKTIDVFNLIVIQIKLLSYPHKKIASVINFIQHTDGIVLSIFEKKEAMNLFYELEIHILDYMNN